MNTSLPKGIQDLVDHFSRLPGIGPKSAIRHVFYLLQSSQYFREQFGKSLIDLHTSLHYCPKCFHFSEEEDLCEICTNPKRDDEVLCVIETPLDLIAIEKTNVFMGKYFLLGGVLSPLQGIGPDELRIKPLLGMLSAREHDVRELILALPSTLEGEATASYLFQKIQEISPATKISRIARGIPLGSEIPFADENTLARAFEGRHGY